MALDTLDVLGIHFTNVKGFRAKATTDVSDKSYLRPQGSETYTENGMHDVTELAEAVVSIPTGTAGTPVATKGTVSNHSISVTPSVTNTAGLISGGTKTGTAVTVSASELVSGSETKTENGTYDVTNLASLIVDVSGVTLPTYTIQWLSTSYGATCDMTYAEVYSYLTAIQYDTQNDVRVQVYPNESYLGASAWYDDYDNIIKIAVINPYGEPAYNITHAPDDTITVTVVEPKDSNNMTVNEGTVTAEAGYYPSNTSKSVASGTEGTPTATKGTVSNHSIAITPSVTNTAGYITGGTKTGTAVTVSASELVSGTLTISAAGTTDVTNYANVSVGAMTLPTSASSTSSGISKATIGRSTSNQYINIPTGYNASAAYYIISATPNGSVTAPSSISGTSATVSTGTNTLTLTKSVSVTPNVTTAGYISSGTAGNASVSLTASITTKAAATITPTTSNQTIASGTYLTGTQTIAGDADLVAANIKAGVNIFNVAGTYTADATATASDIVSGETAYVDGRMVEGTLTLQTYYTGSSAPSSSLGQDGDIYLQT